MAIDDISGDITSASGFVSDFLNGFTIWINSVTWVEWSILFLFVILLFGIVKLFAWNKQLKNSGGFRYGFKR